MNLKGYWLFRDGWTRTITVGTSANLLRKASRPVLVFHQMAGLRKLIRARWSGRLFAVGLAYLLAIEALIASIGIGMSAVAAAGQPEFIICSFVAKHGLVAPWPSDGQNKSHHQPQCPFCFLATQNSVHSAKIDTASTYPAYAELQVTRACYGDYNGGILVPSLYRTTGDPRGPPQHPI